MNAAGTSGGRAVGETITSVLRRLVEETDTSETTYRALLDRLGGRGYGFAMMLLAAPNLTPGPSLPGFSTIFGIPMLALAIGMLIGIPNPRLPRWLAARKVTA